MTSHALTIDHGDWHTDSVTEANLPAPSWLPPGKRAAVCFTIDDVHPGRSTDAYEAGGDLGAGALGHVERLLDRHPQLRVTLFTTADWREISPFVTRKPLAWLPGLRDRVYLTRVLPAGTMRLDRHPEFVAYLRSLPRTEIALHGLHHLHTGRRVLVEFQDEDTAACAATLRRAAGVFAAAGLPPARGMTPPGWNAPPGLLEAMDEMGFGYVASARDIATAVAPGAAAAMSGLQGVALFAPQIIGRRGLVHIPANFQATSRKERAFEIVDIGGLVSVKGHIVKAAMGHVALDGIDEIYCNYLDALFTVLEDRHGDSLWWATMSEIAECARAAARAVADGDAGGGGR